MSVRASLRAIAWIVRGVLLAVCFAVCCLSARNNYTWEQVTMAKLAPNSEARRTTYAEFCSTPDGLRVLWEEGGQLEWKLEQGDRVPLRAMRTLWRYKRNGSTGEQLSERSIWNWFGFYNYGEQVT